MFRIFQTVYSILYSAGLAIYGLVTLPQRMLGRANRPFGERLGRKTFLNALQPASGAIRIWVHAVSVGEVNAIRPLVNELSQHPGTQLFVSTTTVTGQQVAQNHFRESASVFYFPFDLQLICRRFIKRIRPHVVLLAETEIWPSFLLAADSTSVPVILVNGRLSDRSFTRYRRFRMLFGPLLDRIDHYCVQSKIDRERFLQLAVPENRVNWVGNLKFDYEVTVTPAREMINSMLDQVLRRSENDVILVCGSTKPGEEELLVDVVCRLRKRHPQLKLLLAPRHPKRGEEIREIVRIRGLSCCLRSELIPERTDQPRCECVVLDTIGELAQVYEIADFVFIGGSLVNQGGQNIIEPAAFGKPILFGPDMSNFREIAAAFLESYAALQVDSPADFEARLQILLEDTHARTWLGRNARKVIRNNQGAVARTVEIVERFCPPPSEAS